MSVEVADASDAAHGRAGVSRRAVAGLATGLFAYLAIGVVVAGYADRLDDELAATLSADLGFLLSVVLSSTGMALSGSVAIDRKRSGLDRSLGLAGFVIALGLWIWLASALLWAARWVS
ncbi:MAG: hypothetical protein U0P45_01895 [Acidimicrobiales bacterium]